MTKKLSNYRPISHLSFLSKLTERVVKARLLSHLSTNGLLNSYQSAYTKFHSTEITLLSVQDHIVKSISKHQLTALCLVDLSAAFDTIDHHVLIRHLSNWFGISNTALFWLRSYLLVLSLFPFLIPPLILSSFSMVFLKARFSVHFYLLSILLLYLISLHLILLSLITSMLTTLNFILHSLHLTLLLVCLLLNLLFLQSLLGCLLTFSLSTQPI